MTSRQKKKKKLQFCLSIR